MGARRLATALNATRTCRLPPSPNPLSAKKCRYIRYGQLAFAQIVAPPSYRAKYLYQNVFSLNVKQPCSNVLFCDAETVYWGESMAFLLGKGTAVEWLRRRAVSSVEEQFVLPLLSLEGSRTRLQRHPSLLGSLTLPLHLIVATRENRRPSAHAICHLLVSPTDNYICLHVERGVFCSTPAFTFLQMASELDQEALLFLGMELCGRYGIDSDGRIFLRPQTCTPAHLLSLAREMVHVRGRRQALQVAPLVIGNSASPMESALTLILSQPLERGGFGLPAPELNRPLPVTGMARNLWDDDFIAPDLLWEEGKVVIEYDSDLHHSSGHRRALDATRRDVLAQLGYRAVSVTAEHMRTPRRLKQVAGIIASELGIVLPEASDEERQRQVDYQLRVRTLAEHPERLLAFGESNPSSKHNWHSRLVGQSVVSSH